MLRPRFRALCRDVSCAEAEWPALRSGRSLKPNWLTVPIFFLPVKIEFDQNDAFRTGQTLHQAQPAQRGAIHFDLRIAGYSLSNRLRHTPANSIVTKDGITETDDQGFHVNSRGDRLVAPTGLIQQIASALGRVRPSALSDRHFERHLAGQRVGGAAEARVIGPEGHLDHVE